MRANWSIFMGKFGGAQPGAGRPKGAVNKRSQEIIAEALKEGITPLQYMLEILRDTTQDPTRRDEMAKSAAPFIHPKLSSVDATVEMKNQEKALKELE